MNPDEHTLRAGADITLIPQDATRSIVFELNGSLKVDGVEKDGKVLTGFVQDAGRRRRARVRTSRIDLGQVVPANQPVTVRIRWGGALTSPEGGPLANKRSGLCRTGGLVLDVRRRAGFLSMITQRIAQPPTSPSSFRPECW